MTSSAEIDALFTLPLEQFTAARNALAKQCTQAGDRDEAAAVKAMRKPTLTAWALNQVSRNRPTDIERLLEAGERLRAAQNEALEGDPTLLRAARQGYKDEVGAIVHAAGEVIVAAGKAVGAAQLDRLTSTLEATATDDEARGLVRVGRLDRDFEPSGFGIDNGAVPLVASKRPAPDARPARPPSAPPSKSAAPSAPEPASAISAREARRLVTLAKRAEARAERLSREADEAEHHASDLRRLADEAVEAAASARRAADEGGHGTRS